MAHITLCEQCWNSRTCIEHQGSRLLYHSEAFHHYYKMFKQDCQVESLVIINDATAAII